MNKKIRLNMEKQPTYTTCGATCLHAVYKYYDSEVTLDEIAKGIPEFKNGGGTIAVNLGIHALKNGYDAHLYSFNISIFDPTWFELSNQELIDKLIQRKKEKKLSSKAKNVYSKYIEFLQIGGKIAFEDLSKFLVYRYLYRDIPIISSLSCTWLYQDMREDSITNEEDDIKGDSVGHFVVLNGIKNDLVSVADPFEQNPIGETLYYDIQIEKLLTSILLGVSSYDGNLLIIEKKNEK